MLPTDARLGSDTAQQTQLFIGGWRTEHHYVTETPRWESIIMNNEKFQPGLFVNP